MPSFFIHKGITPSNKTEKYRLQLSADVNAYGYKNNKGYRVNILYPVTTQPHREAVAHARKSICHWSNDPKSLSSLMKESVSIVISLCRSPIFAK